MNKIINSRNLIGNLYGQYRNYAFKSDLKIKWNRPEKIPCIKPEKSGDLSALPEIKPDTIMLDFQQSKELETADENVKTLFKIDFNRRRDATQLHIETMVSSVKRHDLDYGSMESTLAIQTARIRSLQEYMEEHPRNKRVKVILKELIDRRKKFLIMLRRWDYKRFEWILEKLDLVFKPHPPYKYHWITRKESLKKLTDIHCENIRNERLDAYRKELQAKQVEFLERKLKNLEFIRSGQIDCNVPVTVSVEEIATVRKQYDELVAKRIEQQEIKE